MILWRALLRCLSEDEARIVMEELHENIYLEHQGLRALAQKIIQLGYYYHSMSLDCEAKCPTC